MKFRKKPVVIEAITYEELVAYEKNIPPHDRTPDVFRYNEHLIYTTSEQTGYLIPTLEGIMTFTNDSMLITGVKGEIYPCRKDIFDMTYEKA